MGHRFAEIAFTDTVKALQTEMGSRSGYAQMESGEPHNHTFGPTEMAFVEARDSFYMASVSETGWPYVQHRGGPKGFVRILDNRTLGFADYSGNRQYVSVGNFRHDNRVSLFFMDYPNRRRLKLLGRVRVATDPHTRAQVADEAYQASIERVIVIEIEAFDWNCPQHITPRYTDEELPAGTVQSRNYQPIGDGPLQLTITAIRQETPRVRSFELRSTDGEPLPRITAGAHIQLPVRLGDGSIESRHYSIASSEGQRDYYEVAVLAEPHGTVSKRLHATYQVGQIINCTYPENHFPLRNDGPVILVAGGIGITPIKSMAETLREADRPFELHYAGRRSSEMAYLKRLKKTFPNELRVYNNADDERLDISSLLRDLSPTAAVYVCGPERLIEAVTEQAQSRQIQTQVHFERFVAPVPTDAEPIRLQLAASGIELEVSPKESVLDALLNAGIQTPYSCKTGVCRTCAIPVLDGEPLHRDDALSPEEQRTLICPCVSRAQTPHLTLDL